MASEFKILPDFVSFNQHPCCGSVLKMKYIKYIANCCNNFVCNLDIKIQ